MAQILIKKILKSEINIDLLFKWILNNEDENSDLSVMGDCSQEDFISYFLNFIHDRALSSDENIEDDLPMQCSTPKEKDKVKRDDDSFNSSFSVLEIQNDSLNTSKRVLNCNTSEIRHVDSPRHLEEINYNFKKSNPISPLHGYDNGFTTAKVRKTSPKSTEKPSGLCFGDFLRNINRQPAKKRFQKKLNEDKESSPTDLKTIKTSRRINPTCLTKILNENECSQKTDNTFDFKSEKLAEVNVENVEEQRNILLEERMKIATRRNSNENWQKPVKLPVKTRQEIIPEIAQVTDKKKIDALIKIYSFLIRYNYVLNLTAELYFLMTLFLQKDHQQNVDHFKENFEKHETLFKSVHNRVYFSTKVLEKNKPLLLILDRTSVKLLYDNESLKNFSTIVVDELMKIYNSKTERTVEVFTSEANLNVCFISDTDNRENFSSSASFHAFRKQRDAFYEILRVWETNHLLPTWNFGLVLGKKIKFIFNLHADPINYMHFSRLFKAQLLKNCAGKYKEEDEFSTLSTLSGLSSEKFSLLKNRITTKQFSCGINAMPTFTGYQEFYKEFLLICNNFIFYSHLKDQLISDILELNDFKFDESEGKDTYSSSTTFKKSLIVCLKSLRILSKFLGFLDCLPYKNDSVVPDRILKTQIAIRSQVQCNLNLNKILENSLTNASLVITLPWVTEYLSMLDYVQLRLPNFLEVFKILFRIHQSLKISKIENESVILIKLCLGWLFDLPHFPEGLYYEWCFQNNTKTTDPDLVNLENSIDTLRAVDRNILKICCPYLEEIKNLLSNSTNLSSSNSRIKHITPVTTLSSSAEITKKKIQWQLEEAFFNGQPASVRKTVDFVSERVASACVKQICYEIVPDFKKRVQEEIINQLKNEKYNENSSENTEKILKAKAEEISSKILKELDELIKKNVDKQISERVPICNELLLSFDALPETKKVCAFISSRICKDKVTEWLKTHVTRNIFVRECDSAVKHVIYLNPEKINKLDLIPREKFNMNTMSPASLMGFIRNFIWDIIEAPSSITSPNIVAFFITISKTIFERQDINNLSYSAIIQITLDMVLHLITYLPDYVDNSILNEVIVPFFKKLDNSSVFFENIVCPKHVMLLAQSPKDLDSWKCLAHFISLLLKEKLLGEEKFENSVISLYKNSWDEATLKTLSNFYRDIISNYRSLGASEDKFSYLLSFISDYCVDLCEFS